MKSRNTFFMMEQKIVPAQSHHAKFFSKKQKKKSIDLRIFYGLLIRNQCFCSYPAASTLCGTRTGA